VQFGVGKEAAQQVKSTAISLFTLAILFSVHPAALACSCVPPPPPVDALAQSDAVFVGTVLKIEDGTDNRSVTFRVTRYWKGIDAFVVTVSTGFNDGDCGYPFQEGKPYLVYAHGEKELHTNICTRTRLLSDAREDLDELGPGFPVLRDLPPVIRFLIRFVLAFLCALGFDVCYLLPLI
jgi:hypothetical protein